MAKTIEQQFKKLTDIEHVLLRPGRYIGSSKSHTAEGWAFDSVNKKFSWGEVTFNPGLIKLFDEIISNSVDHSKRTEGKHLDTIKVEIDKATGEISVFDNGGIPVVIHQDVNEWLPEMLFGSLKSGSNFDDSDDAVLTGQNGEGAGLTNIFSKYFIVETCDGKKRFKMEFSENNHKKTVPKITSGSDKCYTKITYLPDYARFEMATLDDNNYNAILKRVVDIAGTNPHLKVYFNGDRIAIKSFKDYVELYTEEYVYDENDNFRVALAHSADGFQHISFVNSTQTHIGGTHIEYIIMQVCVKLREFFNKKYRVDIKPSEIRNHLMLFVDATIVNPRYSSQTKDELITEPRDWKTSFSVSDKMISKLVKSPVIQAILDWVEAKEEAANRAKLRELNKNIGKLDPRRIDKFSDAIERKERHKTILFLTEGLSAGKAIQSGRGKSPYIGSFPLKGKPLNVRDKEIDRIADNEEIKNIMMIMGLKIGEKVNSINQLRFGKLALAGDSDVDGSHIQGLLINMFDKFWPELFHLGVINIFRTPLVKVFLKDKTVLEFLTEREYDEWEKTKAKSLTGWTKKWYKGLGTSTPKEFSVYLSNMEKYMIRIDSSTAADRDSIDLAFNGSRADDRKVWLETDAVNIDC